MLSLSINNQADDVEAFSSTSRYLNDLLNIHNRYFEPKASQIYPTELQLKSQIPQILKPPSGIGLVHSIWHSFNSNL